MIGPISPISVGTPAVSVPSLATTTATDVQLQYLAQAAPASISFFLVDASGARWGGSTSTFTTDRSTVTVSASKPGLPQASIVDAGVVIVPSATILRRGQFYARLHVGGLVVCAGYVYDASPSLRLGRFVEPGPIGGPGFVRTITGTNPAAGAEVSETVPTGARWDLFSFTVVLVTSAVVATRTSSLVADDGTTANRRFMIPGPGQAASLTRTHGWMEGEDTSAQGVVTMTDTDTVLMVPRLPKVASHCLQAGYRLRTVTASIDTGDDYAAPIYQVEEWVVP